MNVISKNKKAYFTYNILEKMEAGISLNGQEVKSIKSGQINLAGSFAVLRGKEVFLVGLKVPPYQPKNAGGLVVSDEVEINCKIELREVK